MPKYHVELQEFKEYILYESVYQNSRKYKSIMTNLLSHCLKRGCKQDTISQGSKRHLQVMDMFTLLIMVTVSWVCRYVSINCVLYICANQCVLIMPKNLFFFEVPVIVELVFYWECGMVMKVNKCMYIFVCVHTHVQQMLTSFLKNIRAV